VFTLSPSAFLKYNCGISSTICYEENILNPRERIYFAHTERFKPLKRLETISISN
jgi:hypothetical protein